MTKLEDIEKAVAELQPDEFAKFRQWFEELDARLFDRKLEADARSGKLDQLFENDLKEYKAGGAHDL